VTTERLPRWVRDLAPFPFELAGLVAAAATLALLRLHGLDYGWNTVVLTFPSLWKAMPRLLAIGVGLGLVAASLGGEGTRSYLARIARGRWFLLWVRLWVAISVQIYAYMWLKVSIPLMTARLYDIELWRLDRWLHFGLSPTVLAIQLVAGTPLARLVDLGYELWVPSVPVIFAFVFATADDARRRHLALASAVLWVVGAWLYFFVPALGPCYSAPDALAPIRAEMPDSMATQQMLWTHYLRMVRGRGGVVETFSPMLGVAAMPSLHVGAYALFALWARRHARRWFVPFVVATVGIFFGSLATGWHYAVDGYAGALLAWLAMWVADRWEPVPDSDATSDATGESRPAIGGSGAPEPDGELGP